MQVSFEMQVSFDVFCTMAAQFVSDVYFMCACVGGLQLWVVGEWVGGVRACTCAGQHQEKRVVRWDYFCSLVTVGMSLACPRGSYPWVAGSAASATCHYFEGRDTDSKIRDA